MGHLVFVQQSLADFDDVATFLGGLLHLPCQEKTSCGHHPPAELTETLQHVEPVEEHHSRRCRVVTTAPLSGKPTRTCGSISWHEMRGVYKRGIQAKCIACVYNEPGALPTVADLRGQRDSVLTRGALVLYLLSSEVPVEVRHDNLLFARRGAEISK